MKKFELRQIIRAKTIALAAKEEAMALLRREVCGLRGAIESRNYVCGDCSFTCATDKEMKAHQCEAHSAYPKGGLICIHCEELIHFADYKSMDEAQAALVEHDKHCEKSPNIVRIRELEAQIDLLKESAGWSCSYCHKLYTKEEGAAEHERTCAENPYIAEIASIKALLNVAVTEIDGWKRKDKIDREWEDRLRGILGIPNKRVSIIKEVENIVAELHKPSTPPSTELLRLCYIVDLSRRLDAANYDEKVSYAQYKKIEAELHGIFMGEVIVAPAMIEALND